MTNKSTFSLFAILICMLGSATVALAGDGESQYAKLDEAKVHYKSFGTGSEALVLVSMDWTR